MDNCNELEKYANDVTSATSLLINQLKQTCFSVHSSPSDSSNAHLDIPGDGPRELHRARQSVLSSLKQFQIYLTQPYDFIQQLASQGQLLACLRWLGDFQVLACIPLSDNAPIKDVADLTGVSEMQLSRIVRMTATAGFLREPKPGYIAHTALSARFVTQYSFLDAALFLAETGVPAALQTSVATRFQGQPGRPSDATTPYSIAFNTSQAFPLACEQRKKLQRQWPAFSRCAGDVEDSVTEVLSQLDWLRVGSACIVDVCARSTETAAALAQLFPTLQFIVQLSGPSADMSKAVEVGRPDTQSQMEHENSSIPNPRISVQKCVPGSPQAVRDAAIYMFRVPPVDSGGFDPSQTRDVHILPHLWAHLSILKANTAAIFLLVAQLLPDPGSVDPDIEEAACLRDLWKMQLANGHEMKVGELIEIINSVHDGIGGLVVVDKLQSRSSATMAFGIKYQAFSTTCQQGLDH
ncbi:hypothetical protein F5Y13DRAFT_168007 [Hypoxylon sp. FL1857]|nr:hypothetical protein F5Y13DRAFT_168007 [Hypoxylon sp. FL1857]